MIGKIESYGIDQTTKWLENFLKERTQIVQVQGSISKSFPVTRGIPQGSVLGCTMFVIYINDLPELVESGVFLFADDTKIFRYIGSLDDVCTLQHDLDAMCEWSKKWLLLFHRDKCKYLTIGNKHATHLTQCWT